MAQEAAAPSHTTRVQYHASITTGHRGLDVKGGPYKEERSAWPSGGQLVCSGLGQDRLSLQPCGVTVSRTGPSITFTGQADGAEEKPAGACCADALLGAADQRLGLPSSALASLESTRDSAWLSPPSELGSQCKSDASDIVSEDDLEQNLSSGSRASQPKSCGKILRKGKEKKRVGRPLAYKGDPNAPELSEMERRRIKRRIANRESARRVRHKRQEVLDEMQAKMEQLHAHNMQLVRHAQDVTAQKNDLASRLAELEDSHKQTLDENCKMQQEVHALRQTLQMRMSVLEDELDRRAKEVEGPMTVPDYMSCGGPQHSSPAKSQLLSPSAMDSAGSLDACKGPIDWFPSLNLDDMPSRIEAWDALNTFLRDDGQPIRSDAAH